MQFSEALAQSSLLTESYREYSFAYKGTRPDYKIHDPHPYVLALDDDYKYDGHGRSILGLNLNYYEGDRDALVAKINKTDNAAGFRGFDWLSVARQKIALNKGKAEGWTTDQRIRRYDNFIKHFPFLSRYLRRYKYMEAEDLNAERERLARKLQREKEVDLAKQFRDMKVTDKTSGGKIARQNKKLAKKIAPLHPVIAKRMRDRAIAGGINNLKKV